MDGVQNNIFENLTQFMPEAAVDLDLLSRGYFTFSVRAQEQALVPFFLYTSYSK